VKPGRSNQVLVIVKAGDPTRNSFRVDDERLAVTLTHLTRVNLLGKGSGRVDS
jgi:hypothetical protein